VSLRNLDLLLRPRSVAVVGASDREHTVGTAVMRNLLKSRFPGPVFPVHSTRRSVAGVHAYRDVAFLPEKPDLAVICTPPDTVPALVHSLGTHGARAVAILTDGVERNAVLAAAKPHLMRVLGPNSMGLLAPAQGLNASFVPTPAAPGALAFVSQSGALLAAALDWAAARGIGFTYAVSLGDAADVDAADVLDFLGSDPATRAVLLYIESVRSGRKFLSAARAASRAKPVIVMKSGRTSAGAEAAMGHTGADSGDDQVFDAAVARAGMLRAYSIGELFEAAEALGRMRAAARSKLFILTNAGGPGVVAADAASARGTALARAPIDLGGDAGAPQYAAALRDALAESAHDTVLLIHAPSGVVAAEAVAGACTSDAADSGRVLACWMGGERARRGAGPLRKAGVPVYETPEAAVQAFVHMHHYRMHQEALQEAPASAAADFTPDEPAVKTLLARALDDGRERLTDPEGKALLIAYGIPVVDTHLAVDADEAARLAGQIGYPVALKVLSPDLEHRSEVGGVMLNLENEAEVIAAARDIRERMRQHRPEAQLAGFTVQRMIRPPGAVHRRHGARERTLRASADPAFGMVIRLDGAVGLVPLNVSLALDMVERNDPGVPAIAAVLAHLSQLLVHHPEIAELEIDPLLADEKGAMALEVRARVERTKLRPGEHLSIRPYPRELEQEVKLEGRTALLRPIRPEDAPAYAELVARSGAQDLRMRFFTLTRRVPANHLARYTQIDYDREMAFVAVSGDGPPEMLGEVRIFNYPDGQTAEFAILVRSDQQRRGLGRALLEKAIDYCGMRGTATLIGQIQADNEAMLALARRCGMEVELAPNATVAVAHLDLRPRPPEVKLF
jgi:acetyltransferase